MRTTNSTCTERNTENTWGLMESADEESEAGETLCYKQRAEKSTGGEIVLMQWSPTMDLLAAALADHSVILNRLSWQRVWTVPPSEAEVRSLAWRTDGKVLAVGGSDGSVCLYSVEDGNTLHRFSAGAPITQLCWRELDDKDSKKTTYEESWANVLPPLPALDDSTGSFESKLKEEKDKHPSDPKQLKTLSNKLNILIIGDEAGRVHLCVSGVFLAASIQGCAGHVMHTWLSHDFKELSSTTLCTDELNPSQLDLQVQMTSTSLLLTSQGELQHVALMFGRVASLLDYMNSALKSMHEAWEDLLLMMDSKLAAYASTIPDGQTVGDELIVLLACGRARKELQNFLIDELSANGVKKLGLSLEQSYTNIRKYLLSYLNSSVLSLLLLLTDVLGMSRWRERFGAVGLTEAAVQECINHLGTFALKAQELLLVIDQSLQSTKTFFLWLYTTILKLSDEPLPKDCQESMSPDELKLIVDFLRKRLRKTAMTEGDSQTFNLEVVGQYLVNEDLKYVEEAPPTSWDGLVEEVGLDKEAWFFRPNPKKSLIQLFHVLHCSIDNTFAQPMAHMQRTFTSQPACDLTRYQGQKHTDSKTAMALESLMGHFAHDDCLFTYHPTRLSDNSYGKGSCDLTLQSCDGSRKGCFHIGEVPTLTDMDTQQRCSVLGLLPYSADALSVLFCYVPLEQPQTTPSPESSPGQEHAETVYHHAVAQLSIAELMSAVLCEGVESVDVGAVLTQVYSLGVFKAGQLAVSRTRRLAAVLTVNGKKIRLFDVDAEEEVE